MAISRHLFTCSIRSSDLVTLAGRHPQGTREADDGRLRRCVATAGTENVSRSALELRLSGRYFTGLAPTVQMVHLFSVP